MISMIASPSLMPAALEAEFPSSPGSHSTIRSPSESSLIFNPRVGISSNNWCLPWFFRSASNSVCTSASSWMSFCRLSFLPSGSHSCLCMSDAIICDLKSGHAIFHSRSDLSFAKLHISCDARYSGTMPPTKLWCAATLARQPDRSAAGLQTQIEQSVLEEYTKSAWSFSSVTQLLCPTSVRCICEVCGSQTLIRESSLPVHSLPNTASVAHTPLVWPCRVLCSLAVSRSNVRAVWSSLPEQRYLPTNEMLRT